MTSNRRFGREDSESRAKLIKAAEKVMIEEGYAAVTSRRVAERSGLKPQLVHYYFRTMDDLFIALLDQSNDELLVQYSRALTSKAPLKALWDLGRSNALSVMVVESIALANHRKSVRAKISRISRQLRKLETEVVAKALEQHGVDTEEFPPVALGIIIASLSQTIGLNKSLGTTNGLAETEELITRYIERYELRTQEQDK